MLGIKTMKRDEFARNLAAGTYDLIVLDVLRDGPSYGYGIVKRIFKQSKQTIRWHEGTLYPCFIAWKSEACLPASGRKPTWSPTSVLPVHRARPASLARAPRAMAHLQPWCEFAARALTRRDFQLSLDSL